MGKTLSEKLIRGIDYLALPTLYPQHHMLLERMVFSNRALVHELPRLTPMRDWLKSLGLKTIIDVGAYIGAFAFAMRMILPDVQIYCFDPVEENISQINKNLGKWGNVQTFQTALGDRKGKVQFNLNDFRASSSVLEMDANHKSAFPETIHSRKVEVPLARLDDFIPEIKIKTPIFLKVDVQGFELNVLKGGLEILKKTEYLLTEVTYQTLYKDQPLFGDIYKFLTTQGFEFAGNIDSLLSPKNGAILQSDALFIRKKA
jgi:FkbM family methyltransferase